MPDIIPSHAPSPRCLLAWDGTAYRPVTIDAAGHIQIDVLSAALPTGAATAANQATEITALQLIDDLRAALKSVNTDQLQVRGKNQLFSYKDKVLDVTQAAVSGAGGYLQSGVVPASTVWVITHALAQDTTTATTVHIYGVESGATICYFYEARAAFAAGQKTSVACHLYLEAGDRVRVYFTGSLAADQCRIYLTGYSMTKE